MRRTQFWKERCLLAVAREGGTTGQRAWSNRVANEEIVQDRAPDLNKHSCTWRTWMHASNAAAAKREAAAAAAPARCIGDPAASL